MKLIMESWREYITEENGEGPTVGEFLATWTKTNPNNMSKILGKAAKWALGAAVGAGVGLATSGVGTGMGIAAGTAAAAAAAKLGEDAIEKLLSAVGQKAQPLAKFMVQMSDNQVPDDQRTGVALYYDLDDDYENLLQGMDSKLAKEYQKQLYAYFKEAFSNMSEADPEEPLSRYIETTADGFLKNFLANKDMSGVGVEVSE
jgi:hypothetical protein